jgi:hypothetical protein
MQGQAASRELGFAVVPLAVALTVGNMLLFAFVNGLEHSRPPSDGTALAIAMCLAAAFMTAEGGLVGIWIGFARRPLPVRLALAVPGVAVVCSPFLTLPSGGGAVALGGALIVVVVGSVPLLTARAAGFEVIRFSTGTDRAGCEPGESPMQFTLRQMFSWTLAVAMVAGLFRLVFRPDDFRPGMGATFLMDGALCIGCGVVAFAATWATLGRRHSGRRLLAVVMLTGLAALAILWLFSAPDEVVLVVTGWAALASLLTCFGLLLFRRVGFRLVRNRRGSAMAASDKSESFETFSG